MYHFTQFKYLTTRIEKSDLQSPLGKLFHVEYLRYKKLTSHTSGSEKTRNLSISVFIQLFEDRRKHAKNIIYFS